MDYTEAGYKIYGLWCEAGRPGTPEWGVSSIANIIRELDSKVIMPVTQAAPVSPRPDFAGILRELVESVEFNWQCEPDKGCGECNMIRPIIQRAKEAVDSVTLTPSSKEKI